MAKLSDPAKWVNSHIPRTGNQFETELRSLLKVAFWVALLAPVVIIPAYYLLVSFGLAPPILLPSG
ncbi:MAG: hypothetical protein JRN21_06955 [Nitrososphaerota archaeon]|nr:hypothetical protein [Nitrososphaerota archaeon]